MSGSRWRGSRNALLLIVALVAIWQGFYWWVGDVALASPLVTLRATVRLVTGESFGAHVFDTMRAFAIAFVLSFAIGLLTGFWLGFDRLSGDTLELWLSRCTRSPSSRSTRFCFSSSGSVSARRWPSACCTA